MNSFRYLRQYTGPVKACILDWSGTTADRYVLAPAVVFVEVFKKHKVPISMAEARGPMGLRKDLHIQKLTEVYIFNQYGSKCNLNSVKYQGKQENCNNVVTKYSSKQTCASSYFAINYFVFCASKACLRLYCRSADRWHNRRTLYSSFKMEIL